MTKKYVLHKLKWLVLLGTLSFLVYKLVIFDQYDAFFAYFGQSVPERYFWLAIAFLLLPLNLLFETIKWKKIVEHSEHVSLKNAFKSVLAGFFTGFATPNRIGEMGGRMLFVRPENRKIAAVYSLLNSFTQNYCIALLGLPAAVLYFLVLEGNIVLFQPVYFVSIAVFVIIFTGLYIYLPEIVFLFNKNNKLMQYSAIANYKKSDLLIIAFYSVLRFLVFSIQFFVVLQFFGVHLTWSEAAISIPVSYLFVTFTPSLAFSEVAIRSSYAVLFIGVFSDNTAGIAFAGFALWLLNFVLPMLAGARLVANTK